MKASHCDKNPLPKLFRAAALPLLALLLAFALPVHAQVETGFTYNIEVKGSGGKVLDVNGGVEAVKDTTPLQQFTALGASQFNQRFRVVDEGKGEVTLRPKHSGKCLDVTGGLAAKQNGAKIQQYACNGQANQRWKLTALTGADAGWYRIDSVNSGKVMDVVDRSTANGALVQQWDWNPSGDNKNDNQKFRFTNKGKTVVCLAPAPNNEGNITTQEGWEWVGIVAPPDVVQRGGAIRDCLANLKDGDDLVIVAHGLEENQGDNAAIAFAWGDQDYTGFGAGADQGNNPAPVPNGFNQLRNINVTLSICVSGNRPNQQTLSLIEKMLSALGGGGRGSRVVGFRGLSQTRPWFDFTGGTDNEQATAGRAMAANITWTDNPPVTRPGSEKGPNHQTAAQAIVDAAFGGRRVVTVTLAPQRGSKPNGVRGYYLNPWPNISVPANQDSEENDASADNEDPSTICSVTGPLCNCDTPGFDYSAAPADVSGQVKVDRGTITYDHASGRFVQTVTLTNVGDSAVPGPVSLVLDELGPTAMLVNADGLTLAVPPEGSAYVNVPGTEQGLQSQQSAMVVLQFVDVVSSSNPTANINYNTRVLAGGGTR